MGRIIYFFLVSLLYWYARFSHFESLFVVVVFVSVYHLLFLSFHFFSSVKVAGLPTWLTAFHPSDIISSVFFFQFRICNSGWTSTVLIISSLTILHKCNWIYRMMSFIQLNAYQHDNLQIINKSSNFSVRSMEYFAEPFYVLPRLSYVYHFFVHIGCWLFIERNIILFGCCGYQLYILMCTENIVSNHMHGLWILISRDQTFIAKGE